MKIGLKVFEIENMLSSPSIDVTVALVAGLHLFKSRQHK